MVREKENKMTFTMNQLIAHLLGDYFLQSDWMASTKRQNLLACVLHALTYVLPFLFLTKHLFVLVAIGGSHLVIDMFGLSRYVVFAKNFLAPKSKWPTWEDSKITGYPSERPMWLSLWLMIITDNTMHLICNALALRYL